MSEDMSALAVAKGLIRHASVTPRDEGALPYLADILRAAGFETHVLPFAEPGTPEITNLYARIGTASPCLAFAGHTDVVPPGDATAWRFDPFAGEVADGALWGRGAVDMKGAVAASIAAALEYVARHATLRGSIAFLLTGDEEGPGINGTAKLLAWARNRGEVFDHCILGEPTNPRRLGDMIKIGRRGSLNGEIIVSGKQGHVAYPHLADNPIPTLLRLLAAVMQSPLDAGTSHFDPSNLEFTSVDVGNPATNVIPAQARARFNIRFNDQWTPEKLVSEIERRCATTGVANYSLRFARTNRTAFLTAPGPFSDLVVQAVEAETGRRPVLSTSGGASDACFIKDYCPVVEFGLVGETMHAVDERVALADLETLTRTYGRILEAYFAA
jgi:succinyl-diaminopimelate desuccinylase